MRFWQYFTNLLAYSTFQRLSFYIILPKHLFNHRMTFLFAPSANPLFDPKSGQNRVIKLFFIKCTPQSSTRPFQLRVYHLSISFRLDTYSIAKWRLKRRVVVMVVVVSKGWQRFYHLFFKKRHFDSRCKIWREIDWWRSRSSENLTFYQKWRKSPWDIFSGAVATTLNLLTRNFIQNLGLALMDFLNLIHLIGYHLG